TLPRGYPSRVRLSVPKIYKVQKSRRSEDLLLLCSLKLTDYSVFSPEITMPKVSLSGMTVEALMDLRKRVDETLHKRRAEIEKRLERMDRAIAEEKPRRSGAKNALRKEGLWSSAARTIPSAGIGSTKKSPAGRAGLSVPKGVGLSRHRHPTSPNLHTKSLQGSAHSLSFLIGLRRRPWRELGAHLSKKFFFSRRNFPTRYH